MAVDRPKTMRCGETGCGRGTTQAAGRRKWELEWGQGKVQVRMQVQTQTGVQMQVQSECDAVQAHA